MKLVILYATTMGNSKGVAEAISQSLDCYKFDDKRIMAINQYEKVIIF